MITRAIYFSDRRINDTSILREWATSPLPLKEITPQSPDEQITCYRTIVEAFDEYTRSYVYTANFFNEENK